MRPLLQGDIIGLSGGASVLDGSRRATRGPRSQRFNSSDPPLPLLSMFRLLNFDENKVGDENSAEPPQGSKVIGKQRPALITTKGDCMKICRRLFLRMGATAATA